MKLKIAHEDTLPIKASGRIEVSDSDKDQLISEVLAEYTALRAEIIKRIETRTQILNFTLVIAGVFLTVGAQSDQVKPSVLLLYPILATFLAAAWAHSDIRAGAIGQYIKTQIEGRVEIRGLQWEGYLEDQFTEQQPGLRAWIVRNVARRLVEIYAIGIFLSTQLLAIILAGFKMQSCCEKSELLLLFLDFTCILLTASLVLLRRRRHREKDRPWLTVVVVITFLLIMLGVGRFVGIW